MIRVLHVINWLRAGGVETQLMHILREYDRSRFHMDVCVVGGEIGYLGPEVEQLGSLTISCPKSPNLYGFSNRFAKTVAPLHYDIVHSHFETWSGAILRGAMLARVPVRIAHLHSMIPWADDLAFQPIVKLGQTVLLAWGRHWIRRYCTHLMVVSQAVSDDRSALHLNGKNQVFLWTGGVDTCKFSPNRIVQPPAGESIIWVGGLLPSKRIDLQLEILKLIIKDIPHVKLTIVGGGKSEADLHLLANYLNISDSVDFLGIRHDVPELLRSADVFLSCSQVEGLPTALLEAQAAGLPVVATDIAPHKECLAPELHPYLFQVGSPKDAARSIIRILSDSALRDRLGGCGREHVLRKYDASKQLALLQHRYSQWMDLEANP